MSSINIYVIGDADSVPIRLISTSDSPSNQQSSPLTLRSNIPAKTLSQGQLTAFIRNESNDNGAGVENAEEFYYEASLKLTLQNGDEYYIGKLSKTNKCLHWEENLDTSEDGDLVVEADWREFRMHVSMTGGICKTELCSLSVFVSSVLESKNFLKQNKRTCFVFIKKFVCIKKSLLSKRHFF